MMGWLAEQVPKGEKKRMKDVPLELIKDPGLSMAWVQADDAHRTPVGQNCCIPYWSKQEICALKIVPTSVYLQAEVTRLNAAASTASKASVPDPAGRLPPSSKAPAPKAMSTKRSVAVQTEREPVAAAEDEHLDAWSLLPGKGGGGGGKGGGKGGGGQSMVPTQPANEPVGLDHRRPEAITLQSEDWRFNDSIDDWTGKYIGQYADPNEGLYTFQWG